MPSRNVPYTFVQCPCSSNPVHADSPSTSPADDASEGGDDGNFDPRAPRSAYSLYPLEYLLYCEDCRQIRCPRCVAEEIVTYFCPNCQFEVPSSNIRSEGNRCTRNCFQCPICIGPLCVTSIEPPHDSASLLSADPRPPAGSYILACTYCHWSSPEIGIKFDKPNGIYSQLSRVRNGGGPKQTFKELRGREQLRKASVADPDPDPDVVVSQSRSELPPTLSERDAISERIDPDVHFAALKAFYQARVAETSPADGGFGGLSDLGVSSPSSVTRLMNLYAGRGLGKKSLARTGMMREAEGRDEGLQKANLDESAQIERFTASSWDELVSKEQREQQVYHARFQDELRPIPCLLRTKRSKRCPVCRHILTKPEAKISSSRYRICLIAGSYIPAIYVRPLPATSGAPPISAVTRISHNVELHSLKPAQFILTFVNPIFEVVKVTLATPATTPGRFASRVTILCPQFEMTANTDVWDDALRGTRKEEGLHQIEAGKIWDRERNWVSIVLEVVPAALKSEKSPEDAGEHELREDEDVLEIPIFVRLEWEADAQHDVAASHDKEKDGREKRELAYWCVLGIGRIRQV